MMMPHVHLFLIKLQNYWKIFPDTWISHWHEKVKYENRLERGYET